MKLFRVFPYNPDAAPQSWGGALYRPGNPSGRIANPDLHVELYLASSPEAAVAETFGRYPQWQPANFVHADGRALALASCDLAANVPIFDLNDVSSLKKLKIVKPSDVVTRDRKTTRAWSRAIFEMAAYHGASWWSFYNPEWTIYGLWEIGSLAPGPGPEPLSIAHPAVVAAAAAISRQIVTPARPRPKPG